MQHTRRTYAIAFALVVLLTTALLVRGMGRTTQVQLPAADASAAETMRTTELPLAELTPETLGTVVATLHRPEAYSRTWTAELFWDGGSSTTVYRTAVQNGWTRMDRQEPSGEVYHLLTDGTVSYSWYGTQSRWHKDAAGSFTADRSQNLPTYEILLELPVQEIAAADYRLYEDQSCVYAETVADSLGYQQCYWVSVETGLLVAAERWQGETLVQRIVALSVDLSTPEAERFCLPDGQQVG